MLNGRFFFVMYFAIFEKPHLTIYFISSILYFTHIFTLFTADFFSKVE